MIIISSYIAKHEFKPLSRFLTIDDVIVGAKKVIKGLAVEIKSPTRVASFRFFKIRIGHKNKARMIVFMLTDNKKVVPLFIRLKKDKIFGMNMAMNNPKVASQVCQNLDYVLEDIKNKRYQEFD